MTLPFVYSAAWPNATSQGGENQFGGDCMLGKLCRLAKHCWQTTVPLTKIDQARRNRHCKNKTQDEGVDEVYIKSEKLPGMLTRNNMGQADVASYRHLPRS